MSGPNPVVFCGTLVAATVAVTAVFLSKGALHIASHEGDTYHLLDILFRLERGETPHVDFVTPLGILSFAPILAFLEAGLGVGRAFLLAQGALALALLPVLAYAALTRLPSWLAWVFAGATLTLVLALTWGGASSAISVSMYYNRWAWAVAFVVVLVAVVPARGRGHPILDGFIVGVGGGLLLLLKATYFVALAPLLLFAILSFHGGRAFIWSLAGGIFVAAAATAAFGVTFWQDYMADLVNVAGSEVRPNPGVPFRDIVADPQHISGVLLGFAAVIALSKARQEKRARAMFFLVGGAVYVTFQNFGNDPQWLVLFAVLIATFAGEASGRPRAALQAISVAAAALIFPSMLNMALSPFEHLGQARSEYRPLLPGRAGHADIVGRIDRASAFVAEVDLTRSDPRYAGFAEAARRPERLIFEGVEIPHCNLLGGLASRFEMIADSLVEDGVEEGASIFTTGVVSAWWLFGPFEPLRGGAPWYYGDLTGLPNADYVLIPKCSYNDRIRRIIVEELRAADVSLTLVADNDLYALFEPAQAAAR